MSSNIYSQSAAAKTSSLNFAHCDTTVGGRGLNSTVSDSTTTTINSASVLRNDTIGHGDYESDEIRFDPTKPLAPNSTNLFAFPAVSHASASLPTWFHAPDSEQYVGTNAENYTVPQPTDDGLCSKPDSTISAQANPPLLFAVSSVAQGSTYSAHDTKPVVVDAAPQLAHLLSSNTPPVYPITDVGRDCGNLIEPEKKQLADGASEPTGAVFPPELTLSSRMAASTPVPFGTLNQTTQLPDEKHDGESERKGAPSIFSSLTSRITLPGWRPPGALTTTNFSPTKYSSARVARGNLVSMSTTKRVPLAKSGVRANPNQSGVCKGKLDRFDSTRSGRLAITDTSNSLSRSSYMCRKCRAHGKRLAVKGHKRNCPFRNCTCAVCSLVNYGRHIVAKQIALYRDQKNHHSHHNHYSTHAHNRNLLNGAMRQFATQNDSVLGPEMKHPKSSDLIGRSVRPGKFTACETVEDEGPHCRRCRNHGKSNPWKGHKKTCPYRCCICQQCILISLRKSNEKNLREVVQEFMEDRPEKRERHPNKSSGRHDHAVKNQQTVPNGPSFASTPAISINSNSCLPTLTGTVSFPAFHLNHPQSLFPYPYLSKLTEAYTASRLPIPNDLIVSNVTESNDPMRTPLSLPDTLMVSTSVENTQPIDSTISSSHSSATLGSGLFKFNPGDLLCFKSGYPAENQTLPSVNSGGTNDGSNHYQPGYFGEYALDLVKGMTGALVDSTSSGTMTTMTPTTSATCNILQSRLSAFSQNSNVQSSNGKFDHSLGYTSDMGNHYYPSSFAHDYEGTSVPDTNDPNSYFLQTHPMMNFANYSGSNKSFPIPDTSISSSFPPPNRCSIDRNSTWTSSNGFDESYGIPAQNFASSASHEAVLRNLVESAQQQPPPTPDPSSASNTLPFYYPMSTHFAGDSANPIHNTPNLSDIQSKISSTVSSDLINDGTVAVGANYESLQHTSPVARMPQGFSIEGTDWNLPTQWLPIPPRSVFRDPNEDYAFGTTGYPSRAQQAAAFAAAAAAAVAFHQGVSHSQEYRSEGAEFGSMQPEVPQASDLFAKLEPTSMKTTIKSHEPFPLPGSFQLSAQRLGSETVTNSFSSLQLNAFKPISETTSSTEKPQSDNGFNADDDLNQNQTQYSHSFYSMNSETPKCEVNLKSGLGRNQVHPFANFLKDVPEHVSNTWTDHSNRGPENTSNIWMTDLSCMSNSEPQGYSVGGPIGSTIEESSYNEQPNMSFPVSMNSTLVSSTSSFLEDEVDPQDEHEHIVKTRDHSNESEQTEETIDVVTQVGDLSVRANECPLNATVNSSVPGQLNWNDEKSAPFQTRVLLGEEREQAKSHLLRGPANSELVLNDPWINTP